MEDSAPFGQFTDENKLFEFHFDNNATYPPQQNLEINPQLVIPQQPQHFYSYFAETQSKFSPQPSGYSSPQLKPKNSSLLSGQRKRFKTVSSKPEEISPTLKKQDESQGESENPDDDDDDEEDDEDDDDESGSDNGSNPDGSGSKKRGKYKVYSETEKATILNFLMKHGIQKTLEIFSNNTHKITKRKLKSWIESQHKIKGVKGRKTNDPNRDQTLYDWCLVFIQENGRAPTRKEATKKALELSEDPSFQASKGWLDKFSRKYNIEFTPLKIIPPKKKKNGQGDSDSGSATGSESSFETMSPLLQAMQNMQPPQSGNQVKQQWSLENGNFLVNDSPNDYDIDGQKISSFFNFGAKPNGGEPMNYERKDTIPSLEQNYYQQPQANNMNYMYGYPPMNTMNNMGNMGNMNTMNNMGNMNIMNNMGNMNNMSNMNNMNGMNNMGNMGNMNNMPQNQMSINHQANYYTNSQMNTEDNYPKNYQMNNMQQQTQQTSQVDGFLNPYFDGNNYSDSSMKVEYPY